MSVIRKILILEFLFLSVSVYSQDTRTQSKDELFQKAAANYFKRNFVTAEPLLQRVIEENPGNSLAYSYLGDIYLVKKRYNDALDSYKKSFELDPRSGENCFRIGQVFYYKKNGLQSIEYFKKAIEISPNLKFAHYHIGLVYLMLMRDKNNTIENWEHYLKIAPDDPQYDKIKRAITLLKDPNFVIPPAGSDITIEEALLLGGLSIDKVNHKSTDQTEGHESKKTKRKLEDLYLDEDL